MKNLLTFEDFINESTLPTSKEYSVSPTKLDSASIRDMSTKDPSILYIVSKEYFGRPKEIDSDVLCRFVKTETSLTQFVPVDKYATLKYIDFYKANGWEDENEKMKKELVNNYLLSGYETPDFDVQKGNISKYVKLANKNN